MKKAEDFRKAFGPVTPGFESAAKETIRELRAKETQKKRRTAGEWLRYRRPVLAMAINRPIVAALLCTSAVNSIPASSARILYWLKKMMAS